MWNSHKTPNIDFTFLCVALIISNMPETSVFKMLYVSVSQTVACRPLVVCSGPQAVLEEKSLQNCIRHITNVKIHSYMSAKTVFVG
jgi:hypothetical protein